MGYIRRGLTRARPYFKKSLKLGLLAGAVCFVLSTAWVVVLRWLPIYVTPLVILRTAEYGLEGKWVDVQKDWINIEEISPYLQKAVIASEDPKFLTHNGFDFKAILKAIKANKKRKVPIGASTISQQTAKNVFLYPSRTYLRKGLEAYFTVLIETIWNKKRILEVYLNIIELGPGIYGAEAAARHFYNKPARNLSLNEAHSLAAILPNPRRWNPKKPNHFVLKRKNFIRRNLGILGNSYFKPLTASLD